MENGGSDIMKHFMENIMTGTLYPTLNSASTRETLLQMEGCLQADLPTFLLCHN